MYKFVKTVINSIKWKQLTALYIIKRRLKLNAHPVFSLLSTLRDDGSRFKLDLDTLAYRAVFVISSSCLSLINLHFLLFPICRRGANRPSQVIGWEHRAGKVFFHDGEPTRPCKSVNAPCRVALTLQAMPLEHYEVITAKKKGIREFSFVVPFYLNVVDFINLWWLMLI